MGVMEYASYVGRGPYSGSDEPKEVYLSIGGSLVKVDLSLNKTVPPLYRGQRFDTCR